MKDSEVSGVQDVCGDIFFFFAISLVTIDEVIDDNLFEKHLLPLYELGRTDNKFPDHHHTSFVQRVTWCYDATLSRNSGFTNVFLLGTSSSSTKSNNKSLVKKLSGHFGPLELIGDFIGVVRGEDMRLRRELFSMIKLRDTTMHRLSGTLKV
jgi:hypothetical protein